MGLKMRALILLIALTPQLLFAADSWVNYEDNPVVTDSTYNRRDPSEIIYLNDTYYVYYNRLDSGASSNFDTQYGDIGCASAPKLTGPWTEQGVVIHNGDGDDDTNPGSGTNLCAGSAEWDCTGLVAPSVSVEGSTIYVFYNGLLEFTNRTKSIGVATGSTSDPCGTFTKSASNPIFEPADSNTTTILVASQYVLKTADNWRMYYKTKETTGSVDRRFNLATTSHASFPTGWANDSGNPVIQKGVDGLPGDSPRYDGGYDDIAVLPINGTYYMLFQPPATIGDVQWYKSDNGKDTWTDASSDFPDLLTTELSGSWCEDESIGYASGSLHGKIMYMNNGGLSGANKGSMGLFFVPYGIIKQGGSGAITIGTGGSVTP